MKIGEAQQIYRQQVKEYREQRAVLSKQLQSVRSKMEHFQDKDGQFASEAATLELTIGALDEKEDEYQEYLDRLADKYCAHWNATVAEQQADAAEEYAVEMGKILEVARRIMKGATVPAADEKSLWSLALKCIKLRKTLVQWPTGKRKRSMIPFGEMRKKGV